MSGPTAEELAAVLAALRALQPARAARPPATADDAGALTVWRRRREAALGLTPRPRPTR